MNTLNKISIKTAVYINIIAIILAIITHFLVICQIILFDWISGGQVSSYDAQRQISIVSIAILMITILINLWAGKIILKNRFKIVLKIFLIVLCGYFTIGFVMQLLGTMFEKTAMSVLCLLQAIMYLRLVTER